MCVLRSTIRVAEKDIKVFKVMAQRGVAMGSAVVVTPLRGVAEDTMATKAWDFEYGPRSGRGYGGRGYGCFLTRLGAMRFSHPVWNRVRGRGYDRIMVCEYIIPKGTRYRRGRIPIRYMGGGQAVVLAERLFTKQALENARRIEGEGFPGVSST